MNRRELMQVTALGVASLPLAAAASPPFAATSGYDGPGLYLYPAWGSPKAYAIAPCASGRPMLEFRDPTSGQLQWRQSLALDCEFAAKLAPL